MLSWIQQRCSNILRVSRKLIMFKAKSIYDEICGNNEELKAWFVANNSWLTKLMKRKNLSMRRQTTTVLKDRSHFTTKLVKYVHENKLFNGRNFRLLWHGWECEGWYHWYKRCTSQINREWKSESECMLNRKRRQDKIKNFNCFSRW